MVAAESRLRGLLRRPLVQDALSLYGVYAVNYIAPLVTIPYLARVLGPASWGVLAMAQGLGGYLLIVVEYGFSLSATREVARWRTDRQHLARLLSGVLGAQLLLAAAILPVPMLVRLVVSAFRDHTSLLWAAYAFAVLQGANLVWFFQGMERLRLVAALDVAAKLIVVVGIFAFVRSPGDAVVVLRLQAAASLTTLAAGWGLALREVAPRLPSVRGGVEALRLGWSMFLFRGAVSLYTVGNAFILGFFAPPAVVGYYAAAERISKAALGLLGPISQTLYPRLSHLVVDSWGEAVRLVRTSLRVMAGGGALLGGILVAFAPTIAHLLFGAAFGPTIPALRVLSLLPPLIALSNVLGIQWMLPLGLDRPFNGIIVAAGVLNLGLAYLLAPRFGHVGMAWAVVGAEAFVTGTMYGYLRLRRLHPLHVQATVPGGVA
jgi:PST family polysaccharide transporter